MDAAYDLVVMGDINLDWCVRGPLPYPFASLVQNGVIQWQAIDELPGGSGLNLAHMAQEAGFRTLLVGVIGDDPAGRFLFEWLRARDLHHGVKADPALSTGKAVIVRDKHDIRFLLNNTPNANHALSAEDVELRRPAIAASRAFYLSGYALMDRAAPRRAAALHALGIARESPNTLVVFDVVPHQFYRLVSFDEFLELTRGVDVLISEVATMRRFLALGDASEAIGPAMAAETIEALAPHYARLVLRYGPSGCDTEVEWSAGDGAIVARETGHHLVADKRGFGDRLAVAIFRSLIPIDPPSEAVDTR